MGIFDNAINVTINNQEVESITTNNNGLIYQRPTGYELTLTADKNNVNRNETVTLTALLTNNHIPISNQQIDLYNVATDICVGRNITANTETPVGSKYTINVPTLHSGEYIYFNTEHTIYTSWHNAMQSNFIHYPVGATGAGDAYEISKIILENNIMTYYYASNRPDTLNCSNYDMSAIYSTVSGVIINDYEIFGITNTNGEITVTYTPTTTGTKTITIQYANDITDTVQIEVT